MDLNIDKELKDSLVALAACAGIVIIECKAMDMGMNGTFLASSLAALAGIGGFKLGIIKAQKA